MQSARLFLLYLPITMLLPAGLTYYVGVRLLGKRLRKSMGWLLGTTGLVVAGLLASLALMFWAEQDRAPVDWFLEPGFYILGYLLTAVPLLFLVEVGRAVRSVVTRCCSAQSDVTATPQTPFCHVTYAYWTALFVAFVLLVWGHQVASAPPQVTRLNVPISKLTTPLDGYRILQLTDIHLRSSRDSSILRSLVERANAERADLIALTGDVVDGPMNNLRAALLPLKQLRARDGVWVVLGNHEYYADAEACISEFERLGFHVLLDEYREIERNGARLTIVGVTNPKHGMHGSKWSNPSGRLARCNADPEAALRGAPANSTKILLAHQPVSIAKASALGFDLALAGHVHGGGFFPWTLFANHVKSTRSGLFRDRDTWIFISRGLGTFGPKLRLGAPPEMTVLTLTTTRHRSSGEPRPTTPLPTK